MNRAITAVSAAAAAAILIVSGCGSSNAPQSNTAASGGGPSSASANGQITADAATVLSNNPNTPVCNPGSLPNEDEETCQHFWNYMLQWQKLSDPVRGPVLEGSGKAMAYGSFQGQLDDTHWWGPNGLVDASGNTCNSDRDASRCAGKFLPFGKTTNIETFDNGSETKSTVSWKLSAGDVSFGTEYFMAYNNGGKGGDQSAFCAGRSGTTGSGEWVSCSRVSGDGADINTDQPAGNDEDYASYGWVVEDYPVLVGVANTIPGSEMVFDQAVQSADVRFSATGSTEGITTGDGSMAADTAGKRAWLAGFRRRTGDGKVTLTFRLRPSGSGTTTASAEDEGWQTAVVSINVEFAQLEKPQTVTVNGTTTTKMAPVPPTCTVQQQVGGEQATCSATLRTKGGRSAPGILLATVKLQASK